MILDKGNIKGVSAQLEKDIQAFSEHNEIKEVELLARISEPDTVTLVPYDLVSNKPLWPKHWNYKLIEDIFKELNITAEIKKMPSFMAIIFSHARASAPAHTPAPAKENNKK